MLVITLLIFGLLCASTLSFIMKSFSHNQRMSFTWYSKINPDSTSRGGGAFLAFMVESDNVVGSNTNGTSYSKKDVMLNVAKQSSSAAYRVQLPKGMEFPTLTPKQQIVADRMRESLKVDSTKSDLDLLKEELRIIIEKLG